jgi:hypothetical protein
MDGRGDIVRGAGTRLSVEAVVGGRVVGKGELSRNGAVAV